VTTARTKTKHPNRVPFEGVLTRLDQPSDKAPNGARGHRVLLTTAAAKAALPTLRDMPVGFKLDFDGHNSRQRCGVITAAWIVGDELRVKGHIFGKDFPEVAEEMRKPGLMGMSYEMCDAHVQDMRASIWTLTATTFIGAAILLRDKAAYKSTSIAIQAQATERIVLEGTVRIARKARSSSRCSPAPRRPRD